MENLLLTPSGENDLRCGSPAACDQPARDDLILLRQAATGTPPVRLLAPGEPDARIRYRWAVGHHAAFGVWRLLAARLRTIADTASPAGSAITEAARLYDVYSVLFLYTSSCSPERYDATVRADMIACDPAFSGTWSRDHEAVPALMHRMDEAHDAGLTREIKRAARLNGQIHMAVAKKLVPEGVSLLQQEGGPPHRPASAEGDLYDEFFHVRRTATCRCAFSAQILRRLTQVATDMAHHGLHSSDDPLPGLGVKAASGLRRIESSAHQQLLHLAALLASETCRADTGRRGHAGSSFSTHV
ncbi:hypothetical protein B1H18_26795 [Streptomyces tsukubensis]|uniref:Uncharacterized protein n=1 Tax=Streptomyces tsukubensis TaxID=83656 RepID=A0A1V4A219_9ACTN|nr:hypothetical protein B1H18_26795 [Streptomyces tsukubensis]